MADPGIAAFLDYFNALPHGYVPQSQFAYDNNGALWSYPADPFYQQAFVSRNTGEPNYYAGTNPNGTVTAQDLATGNVPGAELISGGSQYVYPGGSPNGYGPSTAPPPPMTADQLRKALDLNYWQQAIQSGNATDDEFRGFVANVFGNSFTLPALFASGAMGANAYAQGLQTPGISQAGSLASDAEVTGFGGADPAVLGPGETLQPGGAATGAGGGVGGGTGGGGGGGISLSDVLKVAPTALSLGSAGVKAISGGDTTPGSTTTVSGPGDERTALLDLLANQQFPSREGGFLNVVNQLVARANASPEMLGQLVDPQLQKMAQQILEATRGVSKTFGPFGGKQIPAAMGAVRAQQPLLDTYLGTQQKARTSFQDFAGGTSLIAPSGNISTATKEPITDPMTYAKGISGLTDLVKQFQQVGNPFGSRIRANPNQYASPIGPTQSGGFLDQRSAYDYGLE